MTFAKINEKMEPCTSKKIKRQKARKCHRQTTIIFGLFKHSLTPKELKKKNHTQHIQSNSRKRYLLVICQSLIFLLSELSDISTNSSESSETQQQQIALDRAEPGVLKKLNVQHPLVTLTCPHTLLCQVLVLG